jgi:hypothetical protein
VPRVIHRSEARFAAPARGEDERGRRFCAQGAGGREPCALRAAFGAAPRLQCECAAHTGDDARFAERRM